MDKNDKESAIEVRMTDLVPVSVIIPVYNIAPYVDKCIESVVGQTYSDIEILIMEGKSTDGSFEKVEAWGKKDRRIKLVSRKDGGLALARNYAVEMARGEYICFIDGDDWIAEDYIEKAMKYARDDVDMIMTSFVWHYDNDGNEVLCNTCCIDGIWSGREANKEYLLYGNHSMWGKLLRRDFMEKYNIIQPKLPCEDLAVYPVVALNARRIASSNEAVLYYRTNREGSLLTDSSDYKKFGEVMQWAEQGLRESGCYNEFKTLFAVMMYKQMHATYKRCIGDSYKSVMYADIRSSDYFSEIFCGCSFMDDVTWCVYGGFSLRWIAHRLQNGKAGLVKHFAHTRLTEGAAIAAIDRKLVCEIESDYFLMDFMNEFEGCDRLPLIHNWEKSFDELIEIIKEKYSSDRIVLVKNYFSDKYMENGVLRQYSEAVEERNRLLDKMYAYAESRLEGIISFKIPEELRYTDVTWQVYDPSPEYGNPYAYGYVAHRIEMKVFAQRIENR